MVLLNRVDNKKTSISTYELSQGGVCHHDSVMVWWSLQGGVQLSDGNLEDLRRAHFRAGFNFFGWLTYFKVNILS